MITWHPSGRRSTETGKISNEAFEDGTVVPFEQARVYDDLDQLPSDLAMSLASARSEELLRRTLDVIADGPAKSSAARLAAVRRFLKHDERPLREVAVELKISLGCLHQTIESVSAKMNAFSEEKSPKK
jgi:hypothetical protein